MVNQQCRTKLVAVSYDLLSLNVEDRYLSLLARKEKPKQILPSRSAHLLCVDHIRGSGIGLYRLACQLDLEGIVGEAGRQHLCGRSELPGLGQDQEAQLQSEGRAGGFIQADGRRR